MTNTNAKLMFETTDCSRCGGSGTYSWCQRFGDKCFKCSGRGIQLTRDAVRARELHAEWKAQRTAITLSDVQPGMRVRLYRADKPLETVVEVLEQGSVKERNPETGEWVQLAEVRTKGMRHCVDPDVQVYRALTADELEQLRAYMLTLPGTYLSE